jgi:hypothetical protein
MKATIVIPYLLFIAKFHAQETISLQSEACSYYGEVLSKAKLISYPSTTEAREIIESIIAVIGLQPHFEIRAADVPNAAAVIYSNKRYVLYNPDFISSLNRSAGSKWASVSILAHEIGHHLNGHTLSEGGSRPDLELEADEFSGFVLNKMGATLDEAQAAMKIAADVKESHTHPAKNRRLSAIEKGWVNGQGLAGKPDKKDVKEPAVVKTQENTETVLAEKYILKDVYFISDPSGKYYVTIRNNFVKVENNQIYIIGRMAQSNIPKYRLMLHDRHYNYLYITAKGKIVNGRGQEVGSIRNH